MAGIFFGLFNLRNSQSNGEHIISQNLIMHENSLKIFESNLQLREVSADTPELTVFCKMTADIDANLENAVSKIVNPKAARHFDADMKKLRALLEYTTNF